MSREERLRVGQRVRDSNLGLGIIVEDFGEPEDRGAYAVKFDNGEAIWGMARLGLEKGCCLIFPPTTTYADDLAGSSAYYRSDLPACPAHYGTAPTLRRPIPAGASR